MSTSMQRLSSFFNEFPQKIREEKDRQHQTNAELSEASGVPYAAVTRLCAGTQADPKLYNTAAICDALGLSLDRLCGLTPTGDIDKAERRAKELEMENAVLKATLSGKQEQVKSGVRNMRVLSLICILLSVSLIVYLFIDSQIRHAGLIRNGTLSMEAWLFIFLIALSIATVIVILARSISAVIRERTQK